MSNEQAADNTSTDNPEDILGFMRDHIRRYLATNGADGHMMNGYPCLVLTTTGKKTGEPRQAAVIYGTDGDNHIIIGSKGGSDTPPAWFVNLLANPRAQIQVLDRQLDVQMRIAEGAERERLWQQMVKIFPPYADYQQKTDRVLPVVVLESVVS